VEEWKKYSVTLGKEVVIKYREEQYTGIAQDVDQSGRLIVSRMTDSEGNFVGGGSVRGLLGYT